MTKQFDLTIENIRGYFISEIMEKLPWRGAALINIEEVKKYSRTNFIFKIKLKVGGQRKLVYLKQAQEYQRPELRAGKKEYIHPERMLGEVNVLRKLGRILPKGVVPEVLFFDHKNHILVMSDVGSGKLLIDEFKKNRVHPEIATTFANIFAKIHGSTWKTKVVYLPYKPWLKYIIDFHRRHYAVGMLKHVDSKTVSQFYRESDRAAKCLIWADPVHRNIFLHPGNKVSLIDFDLSLVSDPMFDLGMFLAHFLWMSVGENKRTRAESKLFMGKFIDRYKQEIMKKIDHDEVERLIVRSWRYAGIYLVSRTDGVNGSYFKDYPEWEKRVRELGTGLFLGR